MVNRFEIAGEGLAVLPGDIPQGVADHVDDAQLHFRFGEGGFDSLGKTLEPVHTGNKNIPDSPVLDLGHYFKPKLGALSLLNPDTEDILNAFQIYPDVPGRRSY